MGLPSKETNVDVLFGDVTIVPVRLVNHNEVIAAAAFLSKIKFRCLEIFSAVPYFQDFVDIVPKKKQKKYNQVKESSSS